jgi:hypothetical protein
MWVPATQAGCTGPARALEAMAQTGRPCERQHHTPLVRTAHGLGRQVTTWTISRPGTLAVPMTQATSLGVAIGATRVRRPSTMVALATPVRPRKLFTKGGRLTGWVHTSLKRQIGDFSQFLFSSTRPGLLPISALLQNRRHLKFLNGWPPIVSTDTCWVRWRQVLHGLMLDPQNNNLPGVSSE